MKISSNPLKVNFTISLTASKIKIYLFLPIANSSLSIEHKEKIYPVFLKSNAIGLIKFKVLVNKSAYNKYKTFSSDEIASKLVVRIML